MSRIAVVVAVILACSPALMQGQRASESVALGRSLLGTIVPMGVGLAIVASARNDSPYGSAEAGAIGFVSFAGGLVVGPSLGYFYAGQPGRAWRGVGLRALGVGALIAAAAASWDCHRHACESLGPAVLVGSAVTLGSAIYDIATVRGAVRRHNREAQRVSVRVAPTYSSQRRAAGVSVQLTF